MFAGSTLGVADNDDHDLSASNLYSRFTISLLPELSFVIPNLDNDMHDVTPGQGMEGGTVDSRRIDLYSLSDYLLDCFVLPRLGP